MGMPVAPAFDQTDFRARTNVPDPASLNTAFDGGDAAVNTDWSQDIDQLIRVRLLVKQTVGGALNHNNLTTEFLLQYENNTQAAGTWNAVGAAGADVEDVQYIAAQFANHDNTTQLLGAGTFVTGDGLEAAGATDSVVFTAEALTETELEFSIEIVGSQVSNGDVINLRLLFSDNDESPPATTFTFTQTPTMTVVAAIDETGRSTTVLVVTSSTDALTFDETGRSTTVLVVTSSADALTFDETARATTVLVVTTSTDTRAENDLGLSTTVLVVTSSTDALIFNEGGRSTTVLVVTTSTDTAIVDETALAAVTVLVVTSSADTALLDETSTTTVTVLVVTTSTDSRAVNELGLSTTVLVVTSSTDTLAFNEGGRSTIVLVVTSSTDTLTFNEGGRSTTVLVVTTNTDALVFGEGGRSTTVLVVTSSADTLAFNEGGRSTTVLVVTTSIEDALLNEGGLTTTVLIVTTSADSLAFNESTAAVIVLVIVTGTDDPFQIFDETGRLTIVLVIVTSTDSGGTIVSGPPGSGIGVVIAAQLRATGADTGLGQRERVAHILFTLVAGITVDRRQQGFQHSLSRTLAILNGGPLLVTGASADASLNALHEFMLINRDRRKPITGQLVDLIEAL